MANVYGFNSADDIRRIGEAVQRSEDANRTRQQKGAYSRPSGTVQILVKPDADIAADTSGTCSVWYGTTKGSETDTGENITAYTRQDVVQDQWCQAIGMANGWELSPLECP